MYTYLNTEALERKNQISYACKDFYIEILSSSNLIQVTQEKHVKKDHKNEIIEVLKNAWELDDAQISTKNDKILIKYNSKNLDLYLSNIILFI